MMSTPTPSDNTTLVISPSDKTALIISPIYRALPTPAACMQQWQRERITESEKGFIAQNAAKYNIDSTTAELAIHASKKPVEGILLRLCEMGEAGKEELSRTLSTCSIRELATVTKSPAFSMAAQVVGVTETAKKILLRASATLGCVAVSDSETLDILVADIVGAIKSEYAMLSPREFEQAIKSFAKNSANSQNHRGEDKKAGEYKAFSMDFFHIIMRDYTQARGKFLLAIPNLLDCEAEQANAKKIAQLATMSPEDIAYQRTLKNYQEIITTRFIGGAIVDSEGFESGRIDAMCEDILRMIKEGVIEISPAEKMELMNYTDELLYYDYAKLKEHLAASDAAAESARTNRTAPATGAFGVRLPSGFKSAMVSLWLATPYAVELLNKNTKERKPDPLYSTLFSIYMLKITFNYAAFRTILRRSDALDKAIDNLHNKLQNT
jgi:hypothetical protein